MTSVFHSGEIAIQKQAGTYSGAGRIGSGIRAVIPRAFGEFMQEQVVAVVASVDGAGRVWASALMGEPGFIEALDNRTVQIAAQPVGGDPLADNVKATGQLGVLVIDFESRGRIRLNGKADLYPSGIRIHTEEVFGNCQKYIQARGPRREQRESPQPPTVRLGETLTVTQRQWIESADTFFIASVNPAGGADASHRGGQPGFVRVSENLITWPDYAGNGMFQTLGNLTLSPQAGLLFIDFERGSVLQLTGRANIIWAAARVADVAGAERLVEFQIEQVIEIAEALSVTFKFKSYSAHNPR